MHTPLTSWLDIAPDSDFSIYNLPFGIFSKGKKGRRVGIAIGNKVIDLYKLAKLGVFADIIVDPKVFRKNFLNNFIKLGKPVTGDVRERVQAWLCEESSPIFQHQKSLLYHMSEIQMHLPVKVGDYTDFYSSIEHATNLGKMWRDPENALLPNWRHLPVGYHGRASSIVLDGTPIHRPKGQVKPADGPPVYQACARLDFELEIAFIIGKNSKLGKSISTKKAEEYIFGMVLFNDWSARDIQKWEYVPLGPFLGKNFASSISPWVVTLEALEPFRLAGPKQEPEVLPYLQYSGDRNIDISLQVSITPENGEENIISNSNYKYMYWNKAQQLAHHTVNGCNVKVGDMMASGTISGQDENSYGSMLEISSGGKKPLTLSNGSTRSFIEDGDTLTLKGYAKKGDMRVGFGSVSGKILPTK
ncbi:MAG: fumarylacetoacetase [Bacteroidota bacterium]